MTPFVRFVLWVLFISCIYLGVGREFHNCCMDVYVEVSRSDRFSVEIGPEILVDYMIYDIFPSPSPPLVKTPDPTSFLRNVSCTPNSTQNLESFSILSGSWLLTLSLL